MQMIQYYFLKDPSTAVPCLMEILNIFGSLVNWEKSVFMPLRDGLDVPFLSFLPIQIVDNCNDGGDNGVGIQ